MPSCGNAHLLLGGVRSSRAAELPTVPLPEPHPSWKDRGSCAAPWSPAAAALAPLVPSDRPPLQSKGEDVGGVLMCQLAARVGAVKAPSPDAFVY